MANANPTTNEMPPAPAGLAALLKLAEAQVQYWRERQVSEKALEDAFAEDGTHTPIGDESAWSSGYTNGRYSEADWWMKTIQEAIAEATPKGYRITPRAEGGFDIEREISCINGLPAWFTIATVHPVAERERLITDGAAGTADGNAKAILAGLMAGADGGAAVADVDGRDGTDRLCLALYGRKARARDYLGGSDARMLHDAADRLAGREFPAVDGPVGRFGHHPDRADDFCIEVEILQAEWHNLRVCFDNGTPSLAEFKDRVFKAMQAGPFVTERCLNAKTLLRSIERQLQDHVASELAHV